MKFSRRSAIVSGLGSLLGARLMAAEHDRPTTSLGLCQYCGSLARELARKESESHDLFQPEHFFTHARALGAGGYQVSFGVLQPRRAAALRDQAESAGMYVEGMVKAPKHQSDLERFDAEMKSAAAVGAAPCDRRSFPDADTKFLIRLKRTGRMTLRRCVR